MSPSTAPHKATDTAIAVIGRAVDLLGTLRSIPDVPDLFSFDEGEPEPEPISEEVRAP